MFDNIIGWILAKLPIVKELEPYKPYVEIGIVLASKIVEGLVPMVAKYPQLSVLNTVHSKLDQAIGDIVAAASKIGWDEIGDHVSKAA